MPRTKKPKVHPDQSVIPGAEPGEKNERVHAAAKDYQKKRDARIRANAKESEAHESLLEAMLDEGLDFYEYGGVQVFLDNKRKARVVSPERSGGAEEGGDE